MKKKFYESPAILDKVQLGTGQIIAASVAESVGVGSEGDGQYVDEVYTVSDLSFTHEWK